ncbi:flavodoxin [Methanocella sp. CWC-04]|uniref:Flavodoxin n=1 Tax=Methanooceanicella nereidis TaxID=2052831 RepID=A0AAP2W5Q6_9EURY|nr:NAD(P)H-dependent oxidoreductase [Methanocella sp. CWC-04]MCD1294357.1 flavodoxin [Methanocella sp. CWC-04]
MKTLIAYYSNTGNTMKVANDIRSKIKADITRIEAEKESSYLFKCINALLKKKTPIKQCTTNLNNYDNIIICSPVWAASAPPAVNQYLNELQNTLGKKYSVVVTAKSSGMANVLSQICKECDNKQMVFINSLVVLQKEIDSGTHMAKIDEFVIGLTRA